jgi:hypothetical protein
MCLAGIRRTATTAALQKAQSDTINAGREADKPAQTDLFDQPEQQEDNTRLLKTIDAVTGKFGRHLLQIGVSRKPR